MTLALAELTEVVAKVTYLPGWTFEVYVDRWDGPFLRIVAPMASSRGDKPTVLGIESPLPPMESVPAFADWLAWRLCRVATHEVREWLLVDGTRVFDPHR